MVDKTLYLTISEYILLFNTVLMDYSKQSGWNSKEEWHPEDLQAQVETVNSVIFLTLNALFDMKRSENNGI